MSHANKVHLARSMQTNAELRRGEDHEGIFTTLAWLRRKDSIRTRVARRVALSQTKATARRAAAQPKVLPRWRQALNARIAAYQADRASKRAAYKAKHQTA